MGRCCIARIALSESVRMFLRYSTLALLLLLAESSAAFQMVAVPVIDESDAPQVRALLDQAWASEVGRGVRPNVFLASALYGQAGKLGSAEGYYRAGRIRLLLVRSEANLMATACLFSAASQLGHHAAQTELDRLAHRIMISAVACNQDYTQLNLLTHFDLEGYITGLPVSRQKIVRIITKLAPRYGIDPHLALAVATVESNLDPWAVSPKQAMGVMQLIPATADRFNVKNPFDAEQNIRGGLSYLRWLQQYFSGDTVRILAAYNAGEKAVDQYGGIPPYQETVMYVARVLSFSGRSLSLLPPTAAGARAESKYE